jgi:hypothetical protein
MVVVAMIVALVSVVDLVVDIVVEMVPYLVFFRRQPWQPPHRSRRMHRLH